MGSEATTNTIIIRDNFGNHTKETEGNIRYANLLIGGKEKDTPRMFFPCLHGLQGQRIFEVIMKFPTPVTTESIEDIKLRHWNKGVELARKAFRENPEFYPSLRQSSRLRQLAS